MTDFEKSVLARDPFLVPKLHWGMRGKRHRRIFLFAGAAYLLSRDGYLNAIFDGSDRNRHNVRGPFLDELEKNILKRAGGLAGMGA